MKIDFIPDENYVEGELRCFGHPNDLERIQEIMKKTDVLGAELNVYNYSSEDCCVIPSTDFTGNCFKCGKQVFVKEESK